MTDTQPHLLPSRVEMIDLDAWERDQRRANHRAYEMAMWRLSKRYGWGIRHPSIEMLISLRNHTVKGFAAMERALIKTSRQITTLAEEMSK